MDAMVELGYGRPAGGILGASTLIWDSHDLNGRRSGHGHVISIQYLWKISNGSKAAGSITRLCRTLDHGFVFTPTKHAFVCLLSEILHQSLVTKKH